MPIPFRLAVCAAALMLAGCEMLPRLADVDNAAPKLAARTKQVVGADGALMAGYRAPIDAGLAGMEQDSFAARHERILQTVNGMTTRGGNASRILLDGPQAWEAMFSAMRTAREHILIESFIFEDLDFGARLSALLIERQQAGVDVRVIYDSVGSLGTPTELFEHLRAHGVAVCEFNPINPFNVRPSQMWRLNHRDHRKIVVVDGHVAFTGGINFHSVYRSGSAMQRAKRAPSAEEGWRDTHVELRGPAVGELQALFTRTWVKQRCADRPAREFLHKSAAAESGATHQVAIVGSSPDGMLSRMYLLFAAAIAYARESVWITSAYFAPDENTLSALKGAAQRGVDVRLLLPGFTDSNLVFHAGRSHYEELLAAGVRIYERRDALLHAKTAVVDGVWSTIGSSNFDWRSFCHNDEVNALFVDDEFGAQMRRLFEDDLQHAHEIRLEDWRQRGGSVRLREWLGRLFDYYL